MIGAVAVAVSAVAMCAAVVPGCEADREPRPVVVFGEFETISPEWQVKLDGTIQLDLAMVDGEVVWVGSPDVPQVPQQRCDGRGGSFDAVTLICHNVDY
jgi:hypothetical protein